MNANEKLLVLADGSERTLMTADHLKEYMPDKMIRRIVLFHVASELPEELRELEECPDCSGLLEQAKRQANEAQRTIIQALEQSKKLLMAGGVPERSIEIKVQRAKNGVARDIIEEARKGYAAVVMRRRGLGTLQNVILGSVAFKLLQSLTFIPIIILGRAKNVKRLLLAVDASTNSLRAVDFVIDSLAGHADYEICVYHAVVGLGAISFDPVADAARTPQPGEDVDDDCIDVYKCKVGRLLLAVRDRLVAGGFDPRRISVKVSAGTNSRAAAIVKEAQDGGFGTIVMGRRGLSRVESFFMGRVSHAVVHEGKQLNVWVV